MKFSLASARDSASNADYKSALMHYYAILHWIHSPDRHKYIKEFINALKGFINDENNENESKFAMLAMGRELYPNEATVCLIAAEYAFDSGRCIEALELAQEASSTQDRGLRLRALVNTENIKSNIMDQWHWAMLNDTSRNEAYARAIRSVLEGRNDCRVLDIGGGTGFLSLIARRSTRAVYCCEMDENICELAKRVCADGGVRVINKHSTEVTIEDLDSAKVDVLITETMDSGLLGEGIVTSLLDAHRRLLNPGAVIVPNNATVYACLIESEAITDEHVAIVKGHRFVSPYVITQPGAGMTRGCEPYWCCYADELKGGFNYLTGSVPVFKVDFTDVSRLENIEYGIREPHTVDVHNAGRVHAIMAWFRCSLLPDTPTISSSVEANTCWQQAIYPIEQPFVVGPGDRCVLAINAYQDRLCLDIVRYIAATPGIGTLPRDSNSKCARNDSESSWEDLGALDIVDNQMELTEGDEDKGERLVAESLEKGGNVLAESLEKGANVLAEAVEQGGNVLAESLEKGGANVLAESLEKGANVLAESLRNGANVLAETDFLFLNDGAIVEFFARNLGGLIQPGAQFERGDIALVDITGLASISGSLGSYNENFRAACYYGSEDYRRLMQAFNTMDRCVLRQWDGEKGFPCKGDVLFCWPITSSGTLCESSLNRIIEWKLLNPAGLVIPQYILIRAELISSQKIVRRSKPQPNAHQQVDMKGIDSLAISFYYDVETSTLPYNKMSEPFDLLELRFDSELPLNAGELPNFLQQLDVHSEALAALGGQADGLLYWFELNGGNDETYSTISRKTAARCAVHLFDKPIAVRRDETIAFSTSLFHANLHIERETE